MGKEYAFLRPLKVGNRTFKNRIIYAAMGKHLATKDGFVTDEYIAYYKSLAEGGVASMTTGIMVIDPEWHYISDRQAWICDDKYIPGLRKLTEEIHKAGSLIFFQPWHSGQAGQPTGLAGLKPITLNDFSIEDIHEIQERWFQAARRAKEAGADGIEFHAAHTYLPCQFISPLFNHRHDEYGIDSIENCTRFSTEIIDRIVRELADDSFMVTAKINGDDFLPGGITIDRAVEVAKTFEAHGVQMITINGGGAITRVECMSDNGVQPEGWKVSFAEALKRSIKIPVAASGSLRHPDYVDSIIREGKADLAAIGRGLLAEKDWVRKCEEGREDELRYCISCMYCFTTAPDGVSGCSVNPFAKRELEIPELVKDGAGRKVLIVGAGPSGLEAAVTLAERGFDVTICDKKNEIGGQVCYAEMPPHKQKLDWMLEYYRKQIRRLGIQVETGVEADEAYIDARSPEIVIIATGSREFVPPIKGADGAGVLSVAQTFDALQDNKKTCPGKTVIIGAGLTGIELAHLVKSRGGDEVEVLEIMPAPASMVMEMKLALKAAQEDGVKVAYEQKVTEVRGQEGGFEVDVTDAAGESRTIKADRVIRSAGIRSENALYEKLLAAGKPYAVYAVGDAEKTGKISTAVQSGADTAYAVK